MKKGDKLVCIKDLTKYIPEDFSREEQEIYYKHRNSEITDEEFKKLTINLFKKQENSRKDRCTFLKGQIYTIIHVNEESSIDVINDLKKTENFSIREDGRLSIMANYHYNDYFITLVEARKKKLDDLSDENFNQFLKNLKKK